MGIEILAEIQPGDPLPTARWYNQVTARLRKLRLSVARDSGLTITRNDNGTVLGLVLPLGCKYAVVATAIAAVAGADLKQGTGQLRDVTYGASGAGNLAGSGPTVPLYSGGGAIAAGRLVIVALIDGAWNVIVDFC